MGEEPCISIVHSINSSAILIFTELMQPKVWERAVGSEPTKWDVCLVRGKKLSSSMNGYFAICILKDRAKGCFRHLSSRMLSSVIFPVIGNYMSLLWAYFKPTECLGSVLGSVCLMQEFTNSQVLSSVGCDTCATEKWCVSLAVLLSDLS